jgi:GNAT superfamily N-acetyltransferase
VEVSARGATEADLPALAMLVAEGLAAVAPQRGAELWLLEQAPTLPVDVGVLRAIQAEGAAVAGCVGEVPVGVLLLDQRDLANGRRIGRITFVFVHPDARGIGVGESMVDEALTWAAGAGCSGLDALALPGDRETKNLYERSGLTARAIVVHRDLRPGP